MLIENLQERKRSEMAALNQVSAKLPLREDPRRMGGSRGEEEQANRAVLGGVGAVPVSKRTYPCGHRGAVEAIQKLESEIEHLKRRERHLKNTCYDLFSKSKPYVPVTPDDKKAAYEDYMNWLDKTMEQCTCCNPK